MVTAELVVRTAPASVTALWERYSSGLSQAPSADREVIPGLLPRVRPPQCKLHSGKCARVLGDARRILCARRLPTRNRCRVPAVARVLVPAPGRRRECSSRAG